MKPGFGECFSCPLGAEVLLRSGNSEVQLKSTLVGLERGEFLIIKTSKVESLVEIDKSVKGIFVHDGAVFGFVSKVINVVESPAPLYFLSFPETIEKRELRKDLRIDCFIPACLHKGEKIDYACVMTNLSSGGCGITLSKTSRQLPDDIKIDGLLALSSEMLGIERDRPVSCIVKNQVRDTRKLQLGLQFDTSDADILERIQSYVDRVRVVIA